MNKNLGQFFFKNQYLIIFFFFYLSVIFGFYFNEDNLGGAANDSIYHFKITEKFNEDFYLTFLQFGNREVGMGTRNSPIFWIFLSFFEKFITYDVIRIINTFVIFVIAVIFYKSLIIKFKNVSQTHIIVLSTFMFLSPSLRSLGIWPYSLLWGLLFFSLSVYYFLKFKDNLDFRKSLIILLNVIVASYIYPSFCVFYIFYLFEISKKFKNKKNYIWGLLFLSFIFSLPCLFYLMSKDFFTSFQNAQGMEMSLMQSLNISNKILIISTISVYLLLPVLNFKELFLKLKKLSFKHSNFLIFIIVVNFYFFNFPYDVWGGGFFHKLSHLLLNNNYLFFLSALVSIFIIFLTIDKKFKNYLLLVLLILYNPQFTIYIKYFDPLVFILFLTLFDFDLKKHFFRKSYAFYQFYGVIIFYYLAIYSKKILL